MDSARVCLKIKRERVVFGGGRRLKHSLASARQLWVSWEEERRGGRRKRGGRRREWKGKGIMEKSGRREKEGRKQERDGEVRRNASSNTF